MFTTSAIHGKSRSGVALHTFTSFVQITVGVQKIYYRVYGSASRRRNVHVNIWLSSRTETSITFLSLPNIQCWHRHWLKDLSVKVLPVSSAALCVTPNASAAAAVAVCCHARNTQNFDLLIRHTFRTHAPHTSAAEILLNQQKQAQNSWNDFLLSLKKLRHFEI